MLGRRAINRRPSRAAKERRAKTRLVNTTATAANTIHVGNTQHPRIKNQGQGQHWTGAAVAAVDVRRNQAAGLWPL